jgi:hypothetical protein
MTEMMNELADLRPAFRILSFLVQMQPQLNFHTEARGKSQSRNRMVDASRSTEAPPSGGVWKTESKEWCGKANEHTVGKKSHSR